MRLRHYLKLRRAGQQTFELPEPLYEHVSATRPLGFLRVAPAQTGADAIAFVRGTCFFSDKVQTGIAAGYDMVIIINGHGESANGLIPNGFFAGGQGSPITPGVASAVTIGHANGHELLQRPSGVRS